MRPPESGLGQITMGLGTTTAGDIFIIKQARVDLTRVEARMLVDGLLAELGLNPHDLAAGKTLEAVVQCPGCGNRWCPTGNPAFCPACGEEVAA